MSTIGPLPAGHFTRVEPTRCLRQRPGFRSAATGPRLLRRPSNCPTRLVCNRTASASAATRVLHVRQHHRNGLHTGSASKNPCPIRFGRRSSARVGCGCQSRLVGWLEMGAFMGRHWRRTWKRHWDQTGLQEATLREASRHSSSLGIRARRRAGAGSGRSPRCFCAICKGFTARTNRWTKRTGNELAGRC